MSKWETNETELNELLKNVKLPHKFKAAIFNLTPELFQTWRKGGKKKRSCPLQSVLKSSSNKIEQKNKSKIAKTTAKLWKCTWPQQTAGPRSNSPQNFVCGDVFQEATWHKAGAGRWGATRLFYGELWQRWPQRSFWPCLQQKKPFTLSEFSTNRLTRATETHNQLRAFLVHRTH